MIYKVEIYDEQEFSNRFPVQAEICRTKVTGPDVDANSKFCFMQCLQFDEQDELHVTYEDTQGEGVYNIDFEGIQMVRGEIEYD